MEKQGNFPGRGASQVWEHMTYGRKLCELTKLIVTSQLDANILFCY